MAWSDPKTWTADDLLTASDLNQYVSDNLSALYALVQGGGRKNLLHNGAMQVAQRGTAAVTGIAASGYYTADRWYLGYAAGSGTWTQSVENDAPTGSGFRKSMKMLCTTAQASPGATAGVQWYQSIEGQNVQSVKKGTASAEPLTLSFWTKSNKTGTYIVELYDADNTRAVSAAYTVASSGTWEQQTVTFPADLTGALDNDANASLLAVFHLMDGSNLTSGTLATTWASVTLANRAVGQTNLAASTNNYWQVTGVQLETGSAATGFEFKAFEQELSECQRYYWRTTGQAVYASGVAASATSVQGFVYHPVPMRPAANAYGISALGQDRFYGDGTGAAITGSPTVSSYSLLMSSMLFTSSGMTAATPRNIYGTGASSYLEVSADL